MNTVFLATIFLLAEAAPAPGPEAAPPWWSSFLPMVLIFAVFWFLILRPMNREKSRQASLLSAMKKNDRVLTNSGIYGVVTNVSKESNEVTIRVDESNNVKLRMTLNSIAQVLGDAPTADATSN